MKKIIKTMIITLSTLLILNTGAKTINAQNKNNQLKNTIQIESQIIVIATLTGVGAAVLTLGFGGLAVNRSIQVWKDRSATDNIYDQYFSGLI